MKRPASLACLALILASCALKQDPGTRRSTDVLMADEIAQESVTTAYDAVRRFRPRWLQTRSSPTFEHPERALPIVYLDGIRLGEPRELTNLRAEVISRMEYMSPSEATNRFGTNHTGGAILVTTR